MSLNLEMITFDCADPQKLAAWWAEAIGGEVVFLTSGDFVFVAKEDWPALGFQRVDEPTPGKNRIHIDVMTSDLEAEVARLAALVDGTDTRAIKSGTDSLNNASQDFAARRMDQGIKKVLTGQKVDFINVV